MLERRVAACRTLDELRDQCLLVGRAAVEVSIHVNPPRQGSARRRRASKASTSGTSAEEKVGQIRPALDHRRRAPAGPGSRNRLDGRPDCTLRIQTRGGTASLRCSGCSTRGSRFRSSRGFSGATPPRARTAATRSSIQTVSFPSRSAPLRRITIAPNRTRAGVSHVGEHDEGPLLNTRT